MQVISTHVRYIIILCCFGLLGAGCNIINPVEQTPTYVHIDSFQFVNNPLVRSLTNSHAISSVWVYYNNNPLGEFDLPVTFPVITNGSSTGEIQLYPGVSINGLNDYPNIYPFYQPDTSLILKNEPGKIITYAPHTTFYTTTKIGWNTNFSEGAPSGLALAAGNIPLQTVVQPDSLVFEGSGSGMVYMNNPGVDSSVDSSAAFTIPSGDAYIEFNYKSDVQFYFGLQSNLSTLISAAPFYLAGINPSNTWQKFYLNITQFIFEYTGTNYNLYIKTSLPAGQPTGRLLLDNIQIVTF